MVSEIVSESKNYVSKILLGMEDKGYYFHNYNHTLEVFDRANYLMDKEGIHNEFQELVQIATLFHDTGFLSQYDHNETMAKNHLVNFFNKKDWFFQKRLNFSSIINEYFSLKQFPADKIDIINGLILATVPFNKPNNKLEEIIKDADIDNMGREDFFEKGDLLRKELKIVKGMEFSDSQWFMHVYSLISKLKFYTPTQIKERGNKFKNNVDKIRQILNNLGINI